jgi:dimethylargininase
VRGCLHLKTGVGEVAPRVLLINPDWIDPKPFGALERIGVAAEEPMAANALRLGDAVVYPAAFPATAAKLAARGIGLRLVPADELGKAEGGVSCCSIVFEG